MIGVAQRFLTKRSTTLALKEARWAYLFLLPSLVGLIIFLILPLGGSLFISFLKWDGMSKMKFCGITNFTKLFTDQLFLKSLVNTAYYTLGSVFLALPIALLLAVILNNPRLKGKTIFRAIYFLPYIMMMVAAAMLWKWLYDTDVGLINYFLNLFGLSRVAWLGNPDIAMFSIIILSIWKNLGFMMVLLLAGLQNIPSFYYEAAELDGANSLQKFRHITFPLLSPTTFFVVITSIISSFQVFDFIYIMTKGGPALSTMTVVYYIYTNSFQDFRFGYGSAVAWILFMIVLALTLFQWKLQKRWVYYD